MVRIHDFVDKIQPAQQIRKAFRLEQHRPVADAAPLLHGADPLAEQLILGRFLLLGLRKVGLRLCDQCFVIRDLGLRVGDLGLQIDDLLVQQRLFLQRVGLFVRQCAELVLQVLLLLGQLVGILLQRVNIRLRHGQCSGRQLRPQRPEQAQKGQQGTEYPPEASPFVLFHAALLIPAKTSGSPKGCRRCR